MQTAHGSFSDRASVPPQHAASQASYSYPPTAHDWSRIQTTIYDYYVLQNQPLHSVRESLIKNHGFKASERMIKARLAKWEYIKNAKREDWGYLAILHETRKKQNKPTIFDVRGHRKTVKDLQRFIRNQNISPEKFLTESVDNVRLKGKEIPDYIRAYTPDPEDILYSPAVDNSLSDIRSPTPFNSTESSKSAPREEKAVPGETPNEYLCYHDPSKTGRYNFEHECPFQNYANTPDHHSAVVTTYTTMSSPQSASPHSSSSTDVYSSEKTRIELEACSHQLLKPVPLKSRIGHNDMRCWSIISNKAEPKDGETLTVEDTCSRCNQHPRKHFPSLDLFEPQQGQRHILNDATSHTLDLPNSTREEGSWVWVSLCFLACMFLKRGNEEFAQRVLDGAAGKFEKLLIAQDPLLLTAAHLMITILHMHDQKDICVRILACVKEVVDRRLAEDDPIRVTISYLAYSADSEGDLLKKTGMSSDRLKKVYHQLKGLYPQGHPYVIAAHHNYAWMLKWESKFVKAEKHGWEVYHESVKCFGSLHMQTVTSLSCIAGSISFDDKRVHECINVYRTMIRDATQILGILHPYTLEAHRRLAEKLQLIGGQNERVINIHKTILFGRATMLGRDHEFTQGQRERYAKLLKQLSRWEDGHGNPSKERREVEDLFEKDPEEAWELVSGIDVDDWLNTIPGPGLLRKDTVQEDDWCRQAFAKSLSRSASPTSSMEYEAY